MESKYKRIHILIDSGKPRDIAIFLVNALLISHGIRRDVLAAFRWGNAWIAAPGDRVRHLRPDMDTAEGWIRRVIKEPGRLGTTLIDPQRLEALPCLVVRGGNPHPSHGSLKQLEDTIYVLAKSSSRLLLLYKSGGASKSAEYSYIAKCVESLDIALPLPLAHLPAIMNILLDRIEAGTPNTQRCRGEPD
ncbi:MAG: hypothetical protein LRS46_03785 [Desulfurococcales archaeon]|nr:hypothetical protein [Desulfurococcales archaeon]